ncbi:MAG: signal peptide peptidase SppA [bacterium]
MKKWSVSTGSVLLMILFLTSGCITVQLGTRAPQDKLRETVVEGHGWDKILIIDINGFLSDIPPWRLYSQPVTTLNEVKEKLRKAEKDRRIKGVVLRINSPGGTVTASDTIYDEVKRFKEKRHVPVVAQMMDTAASGGYYVALAADRIAAQPTSITGSIGVIVQKFDVHELLAKIGVMNTPVKSGEHKDIGSPFRPQTEEEQKLLQKTIDELYGRFVQTVADNRKGLTRDEVLVLADGRIYTSEQALKNRLIDRIGYLNDAIEEVKNMAGLEKARVVMYHIPSTYTENIYSSVPLPPVSEIHLLDLNRGLAGMGSPFLYLWEPGLQGW